MRKRHTLTDKRVQTLRLVQTAIVYLRLHISPTFEPSAAVGVHILLQSTVTPSVCSSAVSLMSDLCLFYSPHLHRLLPFQRSADSFIHIDQTAIPAVSIIGSL